VADAGGRVRLRWCHPQLVAFVVAVVGLAWYVVADPHAPDLAAQVARSAVVHTSGVTDWWVGWFGGLQLPSYSVLAPVFVSAAGARLVGCAATVVAVMAMTDLLRGTRRQAAGAASFAVLAVSDVAAGRLTFALGLAIGLLSLAALRRRHWTALLFAALCCLFTLLAAFFLGIAAVAVVLADRSRRRLALATTACVLAGGLAGQVLFSQTGNMPFNVLGLLGASVTALGVAWLVPLRHVRVGALLMAAAPLTVMVDPGAIGENVVRLSWLVATPILISTAVPSRRWILTGAVVASAAWPVVITVQQLWTGEGLATTRAFYQPLARQLSSDIARSGRGAIGQRVEVIPTKAHWETSYLSGTFQLARGWDRQADVADDPLFYDGTLNPVTYHRWLEQMAVGWVARPITSLDSAGRTEAALVDQRPPYLREVWHNANWVLYRVRQSTRLANGASTIRVTPTSVLVHFAHPGRATIQVRWAPYLVAVPSDSNQNGHGCAKANGAFTAITATASGNYILRSDFRLPASRCT
jgi:hypothetical protein